MAKILTFRSGELRRDGCGACEGASAQVIVFPGVRYERWDQSSDTQSAASTSATKTRARDQRRDVLELAE